MARPSKLTLEVTETVCGMLRAGNHLEPSARAAGISESTLHSWIERGGRTGAANAPYRDFAEAVQKARAEGEAHHVVLIARAAAKSWQAAAWLLERQYPERWGKVSDRTKPASETEKPAGKETFFDELQVRRENRGA